MDAQARKILADIEDKVINKVNLGFDPQVLTVLDNPDASENEIELLKAKIGEEILARLFGIANSAYYGHLRKGTVQTFYMAVSRLGMDFTKVLINFLAFLTLSKDKKVEIIFAKSFATSVLGGKILAKEFGLRNEDAKKVELGGLLLEIGKIIIAIYESLYRSDYEKAHIGDDFISSYHQQLGLKIIEEFKLPDYLKDMISAKCLTLDTELVSLSGIVMTAYSIVDLSFRKFDNKLVIVSPMPDPEGKILHTTASTVSDLFRAVGLGSYLSIISQPISSRGDP